MGDSRNYTNAGNFISAIQGGVDPRTGLFNITLPLVKIRANQLMGPEFSLVLLYSPLSSQNIGFGHGFKLNLSKYDINNGKLSLSTGEEYRVDSNGQIKQKKLKNFIFEKVDDTHYKIIYKSGLVEYLDKCSGAICVPSKIFSPDGRSLSFTWNSEFSPARLTQIYNDENHTICSISYPDSNSAVTNFTIYPNDLYAKHTMTFRFQNDNVVLLSCYLSDSDSAIGDTETALTWSFEYSEIGSNKSYRAITTFTSPTGLTEKVHYHTDKEMEFPSIAGMPPLPCVSEHVILCGPKQARMKTMWTYTQKNYLGNGAGFNLWQPDSDQMLNFLLRDYFYESTANHLDINDEIMCTVRRRYNSYHLLISEETIRNGNVHTKKNEYYAIPGLSFNEQPTQYSLPKTQTESWSELRHNLPHRVQITHLEFDEHGNLVRQQAPDGTVTEHTYYSASGESNVCPPDPYGFVRHLKKITVTPFKMENNEVIQMEQYTWKRLFINDNNNSNRYFLVKNIFNHMVGNRLTCVRYGYFEDRNDSSLYGRIKNRMITVIPNININIDSEKFTNNENVDYHIENDCITEIVEFIGFDGVVISNAVAYHTLTGTKLSETSSQGIETNYRYDQLNRIVEKTICPKSKFERIVKWEYSCGEMGNFVIELDSVGNKRKTIFSSVGHKIGQEFFDTETLKWFETYSCTYNELGEIQNAVVNDWLTDEKCSNKNHCFSLQSTVMYDGWGEIESISYSDGRTVYESTNQINLQRIAYTKSEISSLMTGKSIISYDQRSLLPHSKELRNSMDEQISVHRYKWDGLRRLIEDIDENGAITRREYDECGRLIKLTLSDGTIVNRTYAPHLDIERIATISVTFPTAADHTETTQLLGTQTFDSIGRVKERITGGRKMTYSYQNGSLEPYTVTLPSNKILQYSYNPAIDDKICSINGENVRQIFDYDVKTGNLLLAKESAIEIQKVWKNDGSLKEEVFINNDSKKYAYYTTTLNGVIVDYIDIMNKKMRNELDSFGRIMKVVDGNVEIAITYDDFGRLHTQHTQDKLTNTSLNTSLLYDSLGNEISRTITDNITKTTVVLDQKWTSNGLVSLRTAKQNDIIIREERFSYDCRNRLISFNVTGSNLPSESYGHQMTGQTYTYDALNNLTSVETNLYDGTSDTAVFMYENDNDPCQLTKISHTHKNFPETIHLQYDSDGRMTNDEAGRQLTYDIMGRLIAIDGNEIGNVSYEYDALNRLISQNIPDDSCELYYRGNELVTEVMSLSQQNNRLIKIGHNCCAIKRNGNLILNVDDKNNSPLFSVNTIEKSNELYAWSPYGSISNGHNLLLGFNGERIDPITSVYHLGNGYRAFNTTLMRFTCPDSLSPFGSGGINAYVYCGGDPINFTDPSGHLSWQAILGIVFGAVGIAVTVLSAGFAIAAAGGLAAALTTTSTTTLIFQGINTVSNVTGLISSGLEDAHPDASAALGLVSSLTGITALLRPQRIKSLSKIPKPLRSVLTQYNQVKDQIREARILGKMVKIGQFAEKHTRSKHLTNIKPLKYPKVNGKNEYVKIGIEWLPKNFASLKHKNNRFEKSQAIANDSDELNTEFGRIPDTVDGINDVASVYHGCYYELTSLIHNIK